MRTLTLDEMNTVSGGFSSDNLNLSSAPTWRNPMSDNLPWGMLGEDSKKEGDKKSGGILETVIDWFGKLLGDNDSDDDAQAKAQLEKEENARRAMELCYKSGGSPSYSSTGGSGSVSTPYGGGSGSGGSVTVTCTRN